MRKSPVLALSFIGASSLAGCSAANSELLSNQEIEAIRGQISASAHTEGPRQTPPATPPAAKEPQPESGKPFRVTVDEFVGACFPPSLPFDMDEDKDVSRLEVLAADFETRLNAALTVEDTKSIGVEAKIARWNLEYLSHLAIVSLPKLMREFAKIKPNLTSGFNVIWWIGEAIVDLENIQYDLERLQAQFNFLVPEKDKKLFLREVRLTEVQIRKIVAETARRVFEDYEGMGFACRDPELQGNFFAVRGALLDWSRDRDLIQALSSQRGVGLDQYFYTGVDEDDGQLAPPFFPLPEIKSFASLRMSSRRFEGARRLARIEEAGYDRLTLHAAAERFRTLHAQVMDALTEAEDMFLEQIAVYSDYVDGLEARSQAIAGNGAKAGERKEGRRGKTAQR